MGGPMGPGGPMGGPMPPGMRPPFPGGPGGPMGGPMGGPRGPGMGPDGPGGPPTDGSNNDCPTSESSGNMISMVKVPNENLTDAQRKARKEKLNHLAEMRTQLFPEESTMGGPGGPPGSGPGGMPGGPGGPGGPMGPRGGPMMGHRGPYPPNSMMGRYPDGP